MSSTSICTLIHRRLRPNSNIQTSLTTSVVTAHITWILLHQQDTVNDKWRIPVNYFVSTRNDPKKLMADEVKKLLEWRSRTVRCCRQASNKKQRRPGKGRENAMDANGAGSLSLASLGRGLCPPEDVFPLLWWWWWWWSKDHVTRQKLHGSSSFRFWRVRLRVVSGSLALVLRASRALALSPLSAKRARVGWRVAPSRSLSALQRLLLTAFSECIIRRNF